MAKKEVAKVEAPVVKATAEATAEATKVEEKKAPVVEAKEPKKEKLTFEQKVIADLNALAQVCYSPKKLKVNQED